jgi:CBS domain-containing protein
MNVEDIMTREVSSVTPDTSIQAAAKLMADRHVSGLPVIEADGRLVGIITDNDLILRQKRRETMTWWRSLVSAPARLAREYRKAAGTTVSEVMTRSVLSISPVYEIQTAASILHNRGIRRLPVVRDGRVVGIISRGDLVKALADNRPILADSRQNNR